MDITLPNLKNFIFKCSEIEVEIEIFNFVNQSVIHIYVDGKTAIYDNICRPENKIDDCTHIVLVKDKEAK